APLDFLAVADHATYLGMFEQMDNPDSQVGRHPLSIALRSAETTDDRVAVFREVLPRQRGYVDSDDLLDLGIVGSAWREIIAAAERHNDPGTFTTLIAYEFTAAGPGGENLHRNVIFRDSNVPSIPFSRVDAGNNPEKLWDWMDQQRARGIESLAIPHNSNGSDGWMFQLTDREGNAIDRAYAERRLRNEPLVEVTQVKGTSDTHPLLSPNDEWADFGIIEGTIGNDSRSEPQGSYVRDAYLNGLAMEEEQGFNPYRFGLVGSSDTHNAAGSFREEDYWSKAGLLDITPEQRGSVPRAETGEYNEGSTQYWGASGLAAVWAESNTREDIFRALQRKEAFATTGPRMRVRFFAGYDLDETTLAGSDRLTRAYADGVPMGGDLMADGEQRAPRFLLWATRDPTAAPLARLQVIKGWTADGAKHERVYDAACSDGSTPDGAHRCPDNGARVDLSTCATTEGRGASELEALWRDPAFDPGQRAFYYVRVLQNPTCRWSTWDAIRAGTPPNPGLPPTIQERAWSSPIWYVP
ncbi:MAG: DUF3604 domain-containing protein, partial [Acidobacteria bacterium]|nr:DUF3604 domain-containing protein [Acidobacteriota bacterium]